jgi:hypothetical protein
MNSVALKICSSNASYIHNTIQNDAILYTSHPDQTIHISPVVGAGSNSLMSLKNNKVTIDGDIEITGNVIAPNLPTSDNVATNVESEIYAFSVYIDSSTEQLLGTTLRTNGFFVGDIPEETSIDNVYTSSFYIGQSSFYTYESSSVLNADNIKYGMLEVNYGGTGTTTKTGFGSVVLNSNPTFTGSIYADPTDTVNNPGYSWLGAIDTGLYKTNNGIGIVITGSNIISVDSVSMQINGDCASSTFTTTSDERIKNNKIKIDNALNTVSKLTPHMYNKISGNHTILESGLIAQEIYHNAPELHHLIKIAPDANIIDNDWGSVPARVNYIGIIPYLIKGINELKYELDMKEKRIAELEKNKM